MRVNHVWYLMTFHHLTLIVYHLNHTILFLNIAVFYEMSFSCECVQKLLKAQTWSSFGINDGKTRPGQSQKLNDLEMKTFGSVLCDLEFWTCSPIVRIKGNLFYANLPKM